MEYRFDGLRFDAVHAITEADWLDEMAAAVRATVEKDRHVHLVLEHDGNVAEHLRRDFDAQWNDDGTSCAARHADRRKRRLLRRLCRSSRPSGWRACSREGFVYQGEPSRHRDGEPRGTPSADLPPTAFVLFLQNHDQIGNRAFGDRLTATVEPASARSRDRAAAVVPADPAAVHGRGGGELYAVPVLHRSPRRACRRGARGPTARIRKLCGFLRSGPPRSDPRSQRAGDIRAIAPDA